MLLHLLTLALSSAQTCQFNAGNGVTFDFTPLTGQTFSVDQLGSPGNCYTYLFSPCANSYNSGVVSCSIIQDVCNTTEPVAPVTIFDSTLAWSLINPSDPSKGAQFQTQNGGPPMCFPSGRPRFATVQFVCDNSTTGPLQITAQPNQQGCGSAPGYTFVLPTPYACLTPPAQGCPYTLSNPCVIETFMQLEVSGGGTQLLYNALANKCGYSMFFPGSLPEGGCTNSTLVSYFNRSHLPSILNMLKNATPDNPVIYFWEPAINAPVMGYQNGPEVVELKQKFYSTN